MAAIETGFFAREIEEAAYAAQREIEDGRRIVVGVNAFRERRRPGPPCSTVNPEDRAGAGRAARGLSGPRATRRCLPASLETLERDAREDRNLMPPILEAVQSLGDARGDRRRPENRVRRAPPGQLSGA